MHILRFIVTACITILIVGGSVYAWQNRNKVLSELSQKIVLNNKKQSEEGTEQSSTSTSQLGEVLGETQENITSIAQVVGEKLGETISTITDAVTTQDQKIEIDKAVQQVQQQAASIPEEIFQRARYEYCKQVVSEYEKR